MNDNLSIDPEFTTLLKQISNHIRSKFKIIVVLFLLGIAIGIPIAHQLVNWLLASNLLPNDVNIIILTPVEFIMLQVKVGAWLGVIFAVFWLLIDGAIKTEITKKIPNPSLAITKYALGSFLRPLDKRMVQGATKQRTIMICVRVENSAE